MANIEEYLNEKHSWNERQLPIQNLLMDTLQGFHTSVPPQNNLARIAVPFCQWDGLSNLELLGLGTSNDEGQRYKW